MMVLRLMGSLIFLWFASLPMEIAGRLASEGKAGWGWFLLSALVLSGIALDPWKDLTLEAPRLRCLKTHPEDELA